MGGTSTPRGGTVALTPRQHENRVEKTVSKKRDKYEGKLNELRHMQRQLVEQERQLTSKLSKTYRSSSANGAAISEAMAVVVAAVAAAMPRAAVLAAPQAENDWRRGHARQGGSSGTRIWEKVLHVIDAS